MPSTKQAKAPLIFEQSEPPRGAISVNRAAKTFGLSRNTIKKYIRLGELKVWVRGKTTLVSPRKIQVHFGIGEFALRRNDRRIPSSDYSPVVRLAKEFTIKPDTLRNWESWDPHPAIGRKIASYRGPCAFNGKGRRPAHLADVLQMSRTDVGICVKALNNPPEMVKFPGNPGVWISVKKNAARERYHNASSIVEGIFQHEDKTKGLFFTLDYVRRHYRILHITDDLRTKLDGLSVTLPGCAGGPLKLGEWKIFVYSQHAIDDYLKWRRGITAGGCWIDENEIWQDSDGVWYSSHFLARLLKWTLSKVSSLREKNGPITRFKLCPRFHDKSEHLGRGIGGHSVYVHHEDEVRPLIGIANAKKDYGHQETTGDQIAVNRHTATTPPPRSAPTAPNRDGRQDSADGATGSGSPKAGPDWQSMLLGPSLTAAEIAEKLGEPIELVEPVLRYFRRVHDYGFIEDGDRGVGESRFRYKMADVISHLQKWHLKRQKKAARLNKTTAS